jgi:hypothetical protein
MAFCAALVAFVDRMRDKLLSLRNALFVSSICSKTALQFRVYFARSLEKHGIASEQRLGPYSMYVSYTRSDNSPETKRTAEMARP